MPTKAEQFKDYTSGPVDPGISAASLRAPLRGEILVISVGTTARTYDVPDGGTLGTPQWTNRIVNVYAEGADIYLQVSTGTDANVDETARAVETATSGGRFKLSPSASGNGCWRIPAGTWLPIAFAADARTFALKASGANAVLRTHVAET